MIEAMYVVILYPDRDTNGSNAIVPAVTSGIPVRVQATATELYPSRSESKE